MKKEIYIVGAVFVFIVLWGVLFQVNNVKAEGYQHITSETKIEENDRYYLLVDKKRIEVTKEVFNEIKIGNTYYLKYTYNSRSNEPGQLREFHMDE